MKKIKYLMPILGLSSIAATAIPLSSCGQTQQYTVKFDTQGGSTIADVKVDKNGLVTKPTDPTKTGCVFGGWYKEAECTNAFDFNTAITADITLYAKWEFDGKVNDAELKASIETLYNVNETRNYTAEVTMPTENAEVTFTILVDGTALFESSSDEEAVKEAEITRCGTRWNINTDTPDNQWRIDSILKSDKSMIQEFLDPFTSLIESGTKVEDLHFDTTNKTYTWNTKGEIPVTLTFKYNEKKQITSADHTMVVGSESITYKYTFSKYGETTVPTEIKEASPINLFEANGTATELKTDAHNITTQYSYFYVCDLNKFASTVSVDKLSAATQNTTKFSAGVNVYKLDGTKLEAYTDYEINSENNKITLKNSGKIKMTDTLVFNIPYTTAATGDCFTLKASE